MTAAAPAVDDEPIEDPTGGGRIATFLGGAPLYPLLILFGLNLIDEMDRSAFNVLLPEIRDAFHLNDSGILGIVAVAGAAALLLTVPIAQLADRYSRVRMALIGAVVWAVFAFGTGLAPVVWVLLVARSGSAIGQGVVFPTHNSLLADYYRTDVRPRVYSLHRAGNAFGIMLGTGLGAGLAAIFDWRAPFLVFSIPAVVLVVLGLRLREPVRGRFEREAMGADAALLDVEDEPVSYGEAWRMVWKIRTLRRIFVALPFLAASLIGFAALASLQYAETFHLSEVRRAGIGVPVEMLELIGLVIGARWSTKLLARGPKAVFRLIAAAAVVASGLSVVFALAPDVWVAIAANALIVGALAIVGPGVLAALSLAIPPRARSVGFSIGALFILPGLVVIPLIGAVGDHLGFRVGMLLLVPVFLGGGFAIASVGNVIDSDVTDVWIGTTARAEMLQERAAGNMELLRVRGLEVSYGDVQVLFGIDLDVAEGDVIALLGTNGAGKSTLLKAISGVAEASRGAVVFDGRDITHAPTEEIAPRGIAQVPGGQGVFPALTVAENLRAAGWQLRHDPARRAERVAQAYALFPVLESRAGDAAADLSGGQQQMLALAMAFLVRPRLLMIDELSLGLAPVVVQQLLDVVRAFRDDGTTIILVEQSVNIALTVADTAYFMEKGEIRFHGPTAELLERPDVLRSVFLEGAQARATSEPPASVTAGSVPATPERVEAPSTNGHDRVDAPASGDAAPD
ncbi:MAG TPA: MFS transporter, partial [Acidimicrobiales bacterium]